MGDGSARCAADRRCAAPADRSDRRQAHAEDHIQTGTRREDVKLIGRPSREKLPRYVQQVKAGDKVYWYLRAPGRERMKLEIPSGCAPRSPGFLAIYHAALSGAAALLPASAIGQSRSAAGTVSAAIAAYYQATAFMGLGERTRSSRRAI